jgi:hypothetical protein
MKYHLKGEMTCKEAFEGGENVMLLETLVSLTPFGKFFTAMDG